jgi:hypothetical protein
MSFKFKQVTPGELNRLTPLELVLKEITEIRLEAEKLGYENDAKVLEGVENLIFKKLTESDEEKAFISFGMTLLTSGMHPDALSNNKLLDSVFGQSKQCFDELFNAKDLFINYCKENEKNGK